ncbi:conserved hypothetical protein [Vibrio crassostreae]|nr:hypothetical protein [Vibrio crassostreae]TCT63732.1 hypothetical protein EDB40_101224 [Vibrio crassostreae]CAK2014187.1 conserved hypothetical protein [Vibrio crassostreae]CAK2076924.1 conserved hypothetical protein [Vibrio crassostreae]CAK2084863.1 conserved hypothetical protein [Vibrio crassostreae]CAK2143003.1 conserved hypothetical protein [Vibrio crassostreae]
MIRKAKLPLIILAVIGLISAGLSTELAIYVAMFVAAVGVLALAAVGVYKLVVGIFDIITGTVKKAFSILIPS